MEYMPTHSFKLGGYRGSEDSEKLALPTVGEVYDQEFDEPPPPGLEEESRPLNLLHHSKFRPVKLNECISKIGKYVALALCRQKLHDDVLSKWRASHVDAALLTLMLLLHAKRVRDFESERKDGKERFTVLGTNFVGFGMDGKLQCKPSSSVVNFEGAAHGQILVGWRGIFLEDEESVERRG
ncbi:uncharacterized protein LOC131250752 [Magnolia sinica]|uniref:uncharacterized protein LOC131250752 n=1 Tax=Magnolia sinica TaxID=86752 RepID=UPI00265AD4A7|nr:uncharacterized protein LOC131250752 [Magnolia sinica]